jgi:outer membrane receptor protein involved in Fe transport
MKKTGLLGSSALRSAAVIGFAAAMISPAYGQETTADAPETLQSEAEVESGENANVGAQGEAAAGETITVTGSRIRRPNLESSVPVTSIAGEEFIQQGDTNIGETLNELPQLRSTFSQQNPALGIGIAGLNLLDLRGLGSVRTLVLVNGRRHVAGDIRSSASTVDVNTIPNDLIERVDIVTGAQSSVYGSDAIAGVVNFVLRRDFEGLQLRGNASIAQEGYGGEQFVSAMYGKNFAGGRGNITLHGEYNKQDRLFGSDIKEYRRVNGFVTVDVDPSGSDGNPDRVFLRDVRSATINRYGLVPVTQLVGGSAPCGTSTSALINPSPNIPGTTQAPAPFNCVFLFGPDGRLTPQTGTRVGSTINGSFLGGNGQTGREETLLSILPRTERYSFNALAHYEISDAAELFLEAKYVRIDVAGNNAGTTFTQGGSFDAVRERIRLDNPFLNPADRATLTNAFLSSGCDPTITGAACTLTTATGATSGTRLSAAEIAQINAGTYRFPIGKNFLDIGIRDQIFKRETYRAVAGVRGTFNEDWNYEISANFGKFKESQFSQGFIDRQRLLLSLDAGIDPANPGAGIQCRAKFDPAAAVPFQSATLQPGQNAFIAARLASDIAACVPYNPFGAGAGNQAAANYFVATTRDKAEIEQFVVSGFMSGDTSQLFELPGGPLRFAVGAEYRREKASYDDDELDVQAVTNNVTLGDAFPDAVEVKEAFGEIQLPILKDLPFFEELTLTAAGRVSDYSTIGTVYAYNAGVEWSPLRDVRFRANYGRSVRAPNVQESSFPIVPNFAPGFVDPCSGTGIGAGSATRAANCAADLGPLLANLASLGAPSLPVLSGSNPNLNEEKSDSYTVGVVVQPSFVPGLSISADYFDITVKDVIVSLTAQQIANNCYDSPTLDNPFCPLFTRYRGTGPGPSQEVPGQVLGNSLLQSGLNFASRKRRGVDVDLAYRTNLSDNVRLNTNLIYVHNFQTSNFQDPQRPKFEDVILGELGDPKDEFRWDTDLTFGNFTFGYQMRFIGKMYVNNFEDFRSANGNPPENLDYATDIQTPETFYHAIRFEWNISNGDNGRSGFRFYGGIDNLLDTYPPFGMTGTGDFGAGNDRASPSRAAIFETQGRTFYAGFRARF